MAPLYQHFNKQKVVTSPTVVSSNYTILQNTNLCTTTLTTDTINNTLRIQQNNVYSSAAFYNQNAYIKNVNNISSGAKTVSVIFKLNNSLGASAGFGLALGNNSTDSAEIISHHVFGYNNMWRTISWALAPTRLNAPDWYNTHFGDDAVTTFNTTSFYGIRIVDDGAGLSFYRSTDGGASWTLNRSYATYAAMAFSSPPNQFGFIILPQTNGSAPMLDVTVTSVTVA